MTEIWAERLRDRRVCFRFDNLVVVQAINHQKVYSPPIVRLLRHLILNALSLNAHFVALHVPGVHNSIADAFSVSVGQVPWVGARSGATWESLFAGTVESSIGIAASLISRFMSKVTWDAYSKVWVSGGVVVSSRGGMVFRGTFCSSLAPHLRIWFLIQEFRRKWQLLVFGRCRGVLRILLNPFWFGRH